MRIERLVDEIVWKNQTSRVHLPLQSSSDIELEDSVIQGVLAPSAIIGYIDLERNGRFRH